MFHGTLHRKSKTPKRKKGELFYSSYFNLIFQSDQNNRAPIVFIFSTAVLNILQTRIKFHRNLTHFGSVIINFFRLHIENLADREITAAVPQAPHSSKVFSSSTGICRSSTSSPISRASRRRLMFVMEGSTEGDFGVIYFPSLIPKKLAAPHSSIYLCSAASRYMTFEYPKSCPFSPDIRLAA